MPIIQWIGKEKVVSHHHDVPFRTLIHKYGFRADNIDDKSYTHSGNKIIHGDNLEALKALLPEYEGRVDCVYIDPPYNTGNEGWVYNDNVNDPQIRRWLGEVVGAEGEDLSRHDKWLCMMYPRLMLINKLMSSDASLMISIGFHEINVLMLLCREIFPTKQVVCVTVQTSGGKPSGGFNYLHEYIVFVVNKDFDPISLEFCGGNSRRPFEGLTLSTFNKVNRPNQVYPIFINKETESIVSVGKSLTELINNGEYTGEKENYIYDYSIAPEGTVAVWPITSKGKECVWRQIPTRIKEDWEKGYIKVSKNNTKGHPNLFSVQYLPDGVIKKIQNGTLEILGHEKDKPTLILGENETEGSAVPTIWAEKEFYTVKGSNVMKAILPEEKFDYPKAVDLVAAVIQATTTEDSIILDSFGGSGTTAHAVLKQNKKDDGNRTFILIEMLDYAETITAERVRRAMKGYPYKGKEETELYSKKLTPKNILQAESMLKEVQKVIDDNAGIYSKISKPKISDNCLKVIATKEYDSMMDGLGGAFDYYELGPALFTSDGNLNEEVDVEQMRQYIYYSETHQPLMAERSESHPYLLDYHEGTGYFFYYEKDTMTNLSVDTLSIVPRKTDRYVIYADTCTIDTETLARLNIVFKKIPRDINRF